MATARRLLLGAAFLTLAVLLARHSASLPRTAWFARTNSMAGAALCGGAVVSILCQWLRVSPGRFGAVWWKVVPALAVAGVVLMWGSLVLFPRMTAKPIAWFLDVGCTLCLVLLLRIRKWTNDAQVR